MRPARPTSIRWRAPATWTDLLHQARARNILVAARLRQLQGETTMTTAIEPADYIASFRIATVWVTNRDGVPWDAHVIRIRASDEEDYRHRVRKMFPGARAVDFGPVGLAKRQS